MHPGTIRLAKHLETLCRTIEPNRISPHDLVAAAVNADPDNPNQRIRDLNGIAAIVPTSRLRRVGNAFEGNASDVEYWSIDQAAIRLAIASDVNAIIEAGNAAQGDDGAEPIPAESDVAHSTDFRSVRWFGERFTFTTTQAACVQVLWRNWQQGTPVISEVTVLDDAGSAGDRLRDVFDKGKHPAWGTLIKPAGKGAFCLAEPDES